MALFSRRFWNALVTHDRRLKVASTGYEEAARRFRTSRHCLNDDGQLEFRIEFLEAVKDLRDAVVELRQFQSRQAQKDAP
jgi:hypothetical protein